LQDSRLLTFDVRACETCPRSFLRAAVGPGTDRIRGSTSRQASEECSPSLYDSSTSWYTYRGNGCCNGCKSLTLIMFCKPVSKNHVLNFQAHRSLLAGVTQHMPILLPPSSLVCMQYVGRRLATRMQITCHFRGLHLPTGGCPPRNASPISQCLSASIT
jgi:hypothetical protein